MERHLRTHVCKRSLLCSESKAVPRDVKCVLKVERVEGFGDDSYSRKGHTGDSEGVRDDDKWGEANVIITAMRVWRCVTCAGKKFNALIGVKFLGRGIEGELMRLDSVKTKKGGSKKLGDPPRLR